MKKELVPLILIMGSLFRLYGLVLEIPVDGCKDSRRWQKIGRSWVTHSSKSIHLKTRENKAEIIHKDVKQVPIYFLIPTEKH